MVLREKSELTPPIVFRADMDRLGQQSQVFLELFQLRAAEVEQHKLQASAGRFIPDHHIKCI